MLIYDLKMYVAHFGLYFLVLYFSSQPSEGQLLARVYTVLTDFSSPQAQLTYTFVHILYSVTALPFFFFTIESLASVFTHSAPTGYTREGLVVPVDPKGLSATLHFLKHEVLSSRAFGDELRQNFPRKEYERLTKAVERGEECLKQEST